jgi:phosphoadenosine phosphosulfate reductase
MEMWITGLRKDQTVTRFFNKLVEWDDKHKLMKLNPLIQWTENQVWEYIRKHDVPYNVLHDKGFPSIGCKPCTRAIQPGEDSCAGRWWWENAEHKECGLHNSEILRK